MFWTIVIIALGVLFTSAYLRDRRSRRRHEIAGITESGSVRHSDGGGAYGYGVIAGQQGGRPDGGGGSF